MDFFANLVNSDVMNSDLMKGYEAFRIKVGAQAMWPRLAKKILVLNYDIAYDLTQQKLRALEISWAELFNESTSLYSSLR